MQKLIVESFLTVTPETAWEVFESDAFRDRLAEKTQLASKLLESREEGTVEIRVLEFTSGSRLPAIAAKALGTTHLSYTQTNRFDRATSRLDWTIDIPKLGKRVRVAGVTSIEPHPQGSRRLVDGEIEISIPFIGGRIEKVVAAEFRKSMEQAVDLAREMMPTTNS